MWLIVNYVMKYRYGYELGHIGKDSLQNLYDYSLPINLWSVIMTLSRSVGIRKSNEAEVLAVLKL